MNEPVVPQRVLTNEERSFRESIFSFLQQEGYAPLITINESISFKSEGIPCSIDIFGAQQPSLPFSITFSIAGYNIGADPMLKFEPAMRACNETNKLVFATKAFCNEYQVYLAIDQYLRSPEDFKFIFRSNLQKLSDGAIVFLNEYKKFSYGVGLDQMPEGYGEFGIEITNPIPTSSIPENRYYLDRLRTIDNSTITYERIGSMQAENIQFLIDGYRIFANGKEIATLYLCPYNATTSTKAPKGFKLV